MKDISNRDVATIVNMNLSVLASSILCVVWLGVFLLTMGQPLFIQVLAFIAWICECFCYIRGKCKLEVLIEKINEEAQKENRNDDRTFGKND